jgi:hypothetical protein
MTAGSSGKHAGRKQGKLDNGQKYAKSVAGADMELIRKTGDVGFEVTEWINTRHVYFPFMPLTEKSPGGGNDSDGTDFRLILGILRTAQLALQHW